jgi:hypothetical protein
MTKSEVRLIIAMSAVALIALGYFAYKSQQVASPIKF